MKLKKMTNWKEYKLIELVDKIIDNRGRTCPIQDFGFPLIATNCIRNEKLYPDFTNVRYVSEDTYRNWFRAHPEPDDLIFVLKGTPGRVCWTPNPVDFCIAQDMVGLRANKSIVHPKYLFAIMRSKIVQQRIEALHVGSLIPHFKKGDFDKLYIPIIEDLYLQQYIGNLYYDFCHKIELNNKINQELENLAQTLFKRWFIDFEFPNENGEPYKSSGGEMVDSELGEIPKGWVISKFGDLVDIINGYAFKSIDFNDISTEGILKIRNINGIVVDIVNTDFVSSEVVSKLNNKFKIQTGDILIAMTGAEVGKIGVTPESDKSLWLNQRVGKVVPKNKTQVSFIHTMFNVLNLTEVVKNEAMGSAQPNISSQGIEKIKILIPSINLIDEYSSMFNKKYELFYKSLAENQELVDLRDTLLPKLISGELEINEINN